MESAIEDILFGKRGREDQIPLGKEFLKRRAETEDCEEILKKLFKGDTKLIKAYDKVDEANLEERAAETVDVYKEGFRLGFLLALDVFGLA